jgi:hypothetical protein
MTLYYYQASFDVDIDVPNVTPPFEKGTRDSFWIHHTNNTKRELIKQVEHKAMKCYGIKPTNIELYFGFEHYIHIES